MYGYDIGWYVTNHTATDVRNDLLLGDRHHGNGSAGGQPIGSVVTGGVVTNVVKVTEHKRHRAEPAQTATSDTWRER